MHIINRGGYWYYERRVPRRFASFDPRAKVKRSLKTKYKAEAHDKAVKIEAEYMAYWEALAAGRKVDAVASYEAVKRLAEARGFDYQPLEEILKGPLEELLNRLESIYINDTQLPKREELQAVLGLIEQPPVAISQAYAEMLEFAANDRLRGKSDEQKKKWRQPRELALNVFIEVCGDLPIKEIDRTAAQKFRQYLSKRIDEGLAVGTANKQIGHVSDIFRTWVEYHQLDLLNPFAKLRFRVGSAKTTGIPYSPEFIRDSLLAPGALDGLNEEARDAFLIMVNTGARPSEILCAEFRLSEPIPFMDISAEKGRQLKTEGSARQIPLLGVSLAAARRVAARGGITRYINKADSWSAAVNKYLQNHGLRETPKHSAYSLRHSFEDRMLEAGIDDRIRAELMGHKYARPDYGRGGSMAKRAEVLSLIAF